MFKESGLDLYMQMFFPILVLDSFLLQTAEKQLGVDNFTSFIIILLFLVKT